MLRVLKHKIAWHGHASVVIIHDWETGCFCEGSKRRDWTEVGDLVLTCMSCLYILEINPLSVVSFAKFFVLLKYN